ncbi:NAD-dependent epimerase/dehydratase family protein [Shumkonia mesophila]|uniref:NAD-dependent epimerase/dehydratase family protein n=1 Tax=Shumkonia mesophila TaxID=2838854 RepID=UPI00293432D0|nr:NAD(P)-dependent oxidoreductase [Shumkonia mesophila]
MTPYSHQPTYHRLLITGAAGRLGSVLREGLYGEFPILRLSDRQDLGFARPGEEIFPAHLENFEDVFDVMEDVDAVVHLGAKLDPEDWPEVLQTNIIGTYNVFEAARRRRVKRVVFASSHHVVGFHRRDHVVGPDAPFRPDSPYAVSKVFGEALGRLYADKHGLSIVCQRIGVARLQMPHVRGLSTWLSYPDYLHLTRCCLTAADIHFLVVYGVSANMRRIWDNSIAATIGYTPNDNAENHVEELLKTPDFSDEPKIERLFAGGFYCSAGFDGDPQKID